MPRSYAKVITTPTADTHGLSIILHYDNKRYLVGSLGEGLQRAAVQRGARMFKMSECFLTGRTEWQNTGGAIGMILTLAEARSSSKMASVEERIRKIKARAERDGVPEDAAAIEKMLNEAKPENNGSRFVFFTPPNMNYQLATARRFVFRKGMPVDIHELDSQCNAQPEGQPIPPYWSDQNIKVWPMAILPAHVRGTRRPGNPRKRSFEMIDEKNAENTAIISEDIPEDEHHQLVCKSIVDDMFNSTWRLDTLYETRLAEVNMPASIFVRNTTDHKIEKYQGPLPGGPEPLPNPDTIVLVRKPWPGALVESLPPATPAKESLCYIIRNHTKRGKFDAKKAKELNIPEGPLYAKLTKGESVMNTEGVLITPDQVLAPSQPGAGFAMLDLPERSYIDDLLTRPEWADQSIMEGVGIIFWSCGRGVATDARVKAFMAKLSHIKHIVSSAEQCPNYLSFDSSASAIVRLREIDGKRFQIPIHDNPTEKSIELPPNVVLAKPGQTVQVEPNIAINEDDVILDYALDAVADGVSAETKREAAIAKASIAADKTELERWAKDLPGKDVEITTLGTGSAMPSKYRNVSATLLRVPGWGSLLFDCGENTIGQLQRAFPPDELKQIIAELRIIVISHMHADHHLGTVSLIKAWYKEVHARVPGEEVNVANPDASALFEGQRRLAILAEPAMLTWLYEYAAIEDYGWSRLAPLNLVTAKHDMPTALRWFTPPSELREKSTEQRANLSTRSAVSPAVLGLSDVQAVQVKHCSGARAVALTWPDGFKASYSGDCRPSQAFSRIGHGSTVCIHEATFDDELQGDAEAKHHSTTSEALRVAQAMEAKACVLTHFSQRYQKLPILERAVNGEAATITQPIQLFDDKVDEDADIAPFDDMDEPSGTVTYAPQHFGGEGETFDLPARRGSGSKAAAVKIKLTTDMKVCVAFDLMRVKVGEIAEMQYFTPALLRLLEVPDGDETRNVMKSPANSRPHSRSSSPIKKSSKRRN